jgi:micrococcal nuclease
MSRQRRLVTLYSLGLACLAVVVAAIPSGGPANASTISSGAHSTTQYGTVTYVADGDTIDVAIDGTSSDPDHNGEPGTRIRFLGTQALELYTYHQDLNRVTGECHAVEAAKLLKSLLVSADGTGKRVRLTARDSSSTNLGRLARFVAVKGSDGAWHDVGEIMIRDGQAIPSYQKTEYTWNEKYRELSEAAAAQGVGIWDTDYCGRGPVANLSVRVNWDAAGNDSTNVNGEYIKITNKGTAAVSLAHWWVRDSATRKSSTVLASKRGYIFPSDAKVAAGASVYVHVGIAPAKPAAGRFYFGLRSPIFENVTGSPSYLGDGAYLFDPQGDLRGWQQYPCISTKPRACVS